MAAAQVPAIAAMALLWFGHARTNVMGSSHMSAARETWLRFFFHEDVAGVWSGGVGLFRTSCVTPSPAAPGGQTRCGAQPNWAGPYTRTNGAHDDVGDIVFDPTPVGLENCEQVCDELRQMWLDELAQMRDRINSLRSNLAGALAKRTGSERFSFIAEQTGMFSLTGLSEAQVDRLRSEFHVYMVASSRANIAGVRQDNLEYLADSIAAVL